MREQTRRLWGCGNFSGDKLHVVVLPASPSRYANHLVGNVHANHLAVGHEVANPSGQPTRPAANVQNILGRADPHFLNHRQRDGQMVLFHTVAAAAFRPAVKLVPWGLCSGLGHRLERLPPFFFSVSALDGVSTGGTIMRPGAGWGTASTAESSTCGHGNHMNPGINLGTTSPNQGHHPADHGPPEE
jgi:hypothetical protein